MRYALLSDVHGNLHALEAVIEALTVEHVDAILCAGDLVGDEVAKIAQAASDTGPTKCQVLITTESDA